MQAFSLQVSVKDWNQYITVKEVKVGEALLDEDPDQFQRQCVHLVALSKIDKLIPVLVIRQDHLRFVKADEAWQPNDRIVYLLHMPKALVFSREPFSLMPEIVPFGKNA